MAAYPYRPFDPARFDVLARDRGCGLGRPCHYVAVTGSTNDDLMTARQEPATGTVTVADLQTKGRGRFGNSWSSPRSAENLLFSVLLRPQLTMQALPCYTLAVGLAVRDALQPYLNPTVGIKWTNDVYAAERKLAGILVESQLRGDELAALVVGIGLNVHMVDLPPEIAHLATSLAILEARCLDRELLLVEILAALERRTAQYEGQGLAGILDELRAHDAIAGRRVRVGTQVGTARGIAPSGALLLEPDGGAALVELTSGLVELLRDDPPG